MTSGHLAFLQRSSNHLSTPAQSNVFSLNSGELVNAVPCLGILHTPEHMMNRWMFDGNLYVCHCGLPVSIRDKPNSFLDNSTTQFVVCQKNYTDPSRCRYFKYMAEDYHLCNCHTQASLRVAKSGIHIGKPYYTCAKSYSDPNRCRYFMLYQIEY